MDRIDTTPRYRVGRDLIAVDVTAEVACFEGRLRLRPGHVVDLTDVPLDCVLVNRRAIVESWTVATLGRNGPIYRGMCRWIESGG